ncbi:chaperone protein ClpB1 [Tanacetum coccineum]|uniref:Chaperone protein ClpB1 n=1 Tax=Tanacetum coccineum TaxID=301880 RepID=A0ABQ4YW93_9ASTR
MANNFIYHVHFSDSGLVATVVISLENRQFAAFIDDGEETVPMKKVATNYGPLPLFAMEVLTRRELMRMMLTDRVQVAIFFKLLPRLSRTNEALAASQELAMEAGHAQTTPFHVVATLIFQGSLLSDLGVDFCFPTKS